MADGKSKDSVRGIPRSEQIRALIELPAEALLTPKETAVLLGLSIITLAKWRSSGAVGIPFHRLGRKVVRYRKSEVESFLTGSND